MPEVIAAACNYTAGEKEASEFLGLFGQSAHVMSSQTGRNPGSKEVDGVSEADTKS